MLILPRAADVIARAQNQSPGYVAFRVDERQVVAVVGESFDGPDNQPGREPPVSLGFPFRDAEPAISGKVAAKIASTKTWVLHFARGRQVEAVTDRIVQGSASCTGMTGVLLRIDSDPGQQFARTRDKYFVVEPQAGGRAQSQMWPSTPVPPLDSSQLDPLLRELLVRELPGVQKDAQSEIDRLAASEVGYHRSWARRRQQLDQALSAGQARLQYDVQGFVLERGGIPMYFVRAEWRALGSPAFGAALWIKGGTPMTIIKQDLSPAGWLRMFEFQGDISREQYGLVLNVLDRDDDGWAEVLFARGGYEAMGIDLIELTPAGFVSTGIGYTYGC
jgi:hypothetical protein